MSYVPVPDFEALDPDKPDEQLPQDQPLAQGYNQGVPQPSIETTQPYYQTDSVPRNLTGEQLRTRNPVFKPFEKEQFDFMTLQGIDDQLRQRDIAQLKFLCHDWIPGSERDNMNRGSDLFHFLCRKQKISHQKVAILAELLYRIGRKDILKRLVFDIKEYERFLSHMPSELSNYRILLHEISEDTISSDMKIMKFSLSPHFPRTKLYPSCELQPQDLFIMMEKKGLLGEDNLDILIRLLMDCEKQDMVAKIDNFKGALYPGNPVPIDRWTGPRESLRRAGQPQYACEEMLIGRGLQNQSRNVQGGNDDIQWRNINNISSVNSAMYNHYSNNPRNVLDSMDGDLPCYKMDANPRGICVIINIFNFHKDPNRPESKELKPREGSTVDRDNLIDTFSKLKFKVEVFENLKAQNIVSILNHYALNIDHSKYDCFACCILSHGKKNELYGSDGIVIGVDEITNFYKASLCPTLTGKPKLFFIQACQGREKQAGFPIPKDIPLEEDLETDDAGIEIPETIPNEADFLLSYATLPGFVSYRSRTHGSWFVNALVENLNLYAHKYDLMSIMIKVNEEVAKMIAPMAENKEYKQVPVPQPTLRKKIYFK